MCILHSPMALNSPNPGDFNVNGWLNVVEWYIPSVSGRTFRVAFRKENKAHHDDEAQDNQTRK